LKPTVAAHMEGAGMVCCRQDYCYSCLYKSL